ncbi:MAG: hypothetical protein H6585_08395 [Flavobacteriales bacterium]|nr:hypothetical protein [Flavobacteriales bacterium]MCB9448348.1 hypothetical protein [Flavobacteriales bacterium]
MKHAFIYLAGVCMLTLTACTSPPDEQAWEKVKHSASWEDFFCFTHRFPESIHAEEADSAMVEVRMADKDSATDIGPALWYVIHRPEGKDVEKYFRLLNAYAHKGYRYFARMDELLISCGDTFWLDVNLIPEYDDEDYAIKLKTCNFFSILLNAQGQMLAEGQPVSKAVLSDLLKPYLIGDRNNDTFPECQDSNYTHSSRKYKCKHFIAVDWDINTPCDTVLNTLHQVVKIFRELRSEQSPVLFGKALEKLSREEWDELMDIYPIRISMNKYEYLPLPPPPPPSK